MLNWAMQIKKFILLNNWTETALLKKLPLHVQLMLSQALGAPGLQTATGNEEPKGKGGRILGPQL